VTEAAAAGTPEGIKTLVPKLRYVLGPCLRFKHGIWIDLVHALLRPFFHLHQLRFFENLEML
jgi:hypothetical protein